MLPEPPIPPDFEGVDDLSSSVFRAFIRAARTHGHLMVRSLSEKAMHPAQIMCLRVLARADGISQRDLAEMLHVSRPTVTNMLQTMEKAGTVERRPDESDQRLTRVYLSEQGREMELKLRSVMAEYIGKTVGPMSDDDKRELTRLLDQFTHNIEQAAGGAGIAGGCLRHDADETEEEAG